MKPNIEVEYKVLVSLKQAQALLSHYPDYKIIDQTNYYFDTPISLKKRGIGIRIRQIKNKYIFTLKEKITKGHIEHEFEINNFSLDDNRIVELFTKLDIHNPKLIGSLHTIRHEIKTEFATLCIDYNDYNNIKDFEIEYELFDPSQDLLEEFIKVLQTANIEYIPNKRSKIQRMIESKED